jgi:hypothetical protein
MMFASERASKSGVTSSVRRRPWLTPGVGGIGSASFLTDVGHEVPTALMASLVTATLGAPAAALGLIEGVSDGLAGAGRFVGGALADDPQRRRTVAVGGYSATAILSALIGVTTSVVQAGVLRGAAWAARGLRVPARNALLADVVPDGAYGRAYGFERTMDNLGAIVGPALALGLVSLFSIRTAILVSVIPGLLAAVAIVYAIRQAKLPKVTERKKLRFQIRPVLRASWAGCSPGSPRSRWATLLILRATDILIPGRGLHGATRIGIALYVVYNIAATITSFPVGGLSDKLGGAAHCWSPRPGPPHFCWLTACSRSTDRCSWCSGRPSRWPVSASAARRPPSTPRWPHSLPMRCAAQRSGYWPPCKPSGTWPPARSPDSCTR